MQRFIVYSALAMSLVACKVKESDDDDDEFDVPSFLK